MSRLGDVATALVTVCAIVVTAAVVKREFLDDPAVPTTSAPTIVENAENYRKGGHLIGPRNARVVLVEFSDFECEFCARFSNTIRGVMRAFPSDVSLVYRHFPLTATHKHAFTAALASECAAAQGKFARFHDALFARQDSIGVTPWESYARSAGLPDLEMFTGCIRDSVFKERVLTDVEAGNRLGVGGTPTFLVNDLLVRGGVDSVQLSAYVRAALRDN